MRFKAKARNNTLGNTMEDMRHDRAMRTIELFAGIGGMALALPRGFELVAAFDQDEAARRTHLLNHGVPVFPQDLASIAAQDLARHEAPAWLLSPPCQPFTRRGRVRDVDDPRCRGLLRIIELLPVLRPERVLVENVVGFGGSRAHALLVLALRELGHDVDTIETCPSDTGWPIRRRRQFVVSSAEALRTPFLMDPPVPVQRAIRLDPPEELLVPAGQRIRVNRSLPFPTVTRSYGHATTGAGPILATAFGPRYLSSEEILALHAFPPGFRFPAGMDLRTRWRLAGNSVHVASVRSVLGRWRT